MFLKRVQVPDFRVLQDVDIAFEPDFFPKIFPLGSLNGGGKSTLLQLIFILLHCSCDAEKLKFVKNILYGFKIHKNSQERVLAKFEILDNKEIKKIEFFTCRDSYLKDIFDNSNSKYKDEDKSYLFFSISLKLERLLERISTLENDITSLEKILSRIDRVISLKDTEERFFLFDNELEKLSGLDIQLSPRLLELNRQTRMRKVSQRFSHGAAQELQEELQEQIEFSKLEIEHFYTRQSNLERVSQKIQEYLQSEKILFICNYSAQGNEEEEVLLCRYDHQNLEQAELFLNNISQSIFLAAPSTQIFLFLAQNLKKLLFKESSDDKSNNMNYNSQLELAKSTLPSFFTYDFFAVDLLISAFKKSRDKDFQVAIEQGEYGKNYQELLNDLNSLLQNKKININHDLSGVNFKLIKDDEEIELYPEDLSHGELKRLCIYMWLKSSNIENAIVLMDEIEIALHPDWQYKIITDLKTWAPSNQYILATHSYELLQAVTPAHVKELEPKLLKSKK